MTEKRALEKTIEMWENLKKLYKENPYHFIWDLKNIYFEDILRINPKYNKPLYSCYLCEYAKDSEDKHINTDCTKCPVKNWSIYGKEDKNCKYCTDYNSVYRTGTSNNIINNVLKVLKETYNDLYNN